MSKVFWNGGALLAPVPPALVSCGTPENPNVLTIAWTGIINTKPPMTYISVRPSRHSYNIIKESGEFAINLTTSSMCKTADTGNPNRRSGSYGRKNRRYWHTKRGSSTVPVISRIFFPQNGPPARSAPHSRLRKMPEAPACYTRRSETKVPFPTWKAAASDSSNPARTGTYS